MSMLSTDPPPKFAPDERFEAFLAAECVHLRNGTSRSVHSTHDDRYVVKVALTSADVMYNWVEIAAYLNFESDREKLAAIYSWSISGHFLVMEKLDMTTVSIASFDYPYWITDRKHSNIGTSKAGALKVCDYALIRDSQFGFSSDFA